MAAFIIGMQKTASLASSKKIVEQRFREFFKDVEQSGSHDSARMCAVGAPDFTGVENIFWLTANQSESAAFRDAGGKSGVPAMCQT